MKTEKLFERYGTAATVRIIGEVSQTYNFKAFVQPLRYKNKLYLRGKYTEIGKNKEDYYLYIGPPDIDISQVDGEFVTLSIDEVPYLVYRTEKHNISGENAYNWAIIRPIVTDDEADEDDEDEEDYGGAVG